MRTSSVGAFSSMDSYPAAMNYKILQARSAPVHTHIANPLLMLAASLSETNTIDQALVEAKRGGNLFAGKHMEAISGIVPIKGNVCSSCVPKAFFQASCLECLAGLPCCKNMHVVMEPSRSEA